ncbi:MAG: glycosyltransferase [Actinomycetota bacterium]
MKVLILHSRYLGAVSGENQVVESEARLLREAGHDVRVWEPRPRSTAGMGLLQTGLDAIWSRSAARRVRALTEADQPDVVHVHNLFPSLSPAVIRVARAGGAAVVMTLHNYRLLCLPATLVRNGASCELCVGRFPLPGIRYRCYRGSLPGSAALAFSLGLHRATKTFGLVDRFLAVSEFVRAKHVEGGLPEESVVVKPHFSWPSPRRTGPGDYFLFLGRLAREKGLASILGSWRRVASPLVVVGEGPELERLRALAPPGVEFRGPVPPEDVSALVSGARAILVPSLWQEPAGRILLEAFSAGVPVLASEVGGMAETVQHDVSGLLLPPGDAVAWEHAILRLGSDADSERLGAGAWTQWRERHGPDQGLKDLEHAYRSAIRSRRAIR